MNSSNPQNLNISSWFYLPEWQKYPIQRIDPSFYKSKHCLIFCDQSFISSKIIFTLAISDISVDIVKVGDEYESKEGLHILNPSKKENFFKLFDILNESNKLPSIIIYCWTFLRTNGEVNFIELTSLFSAIAAQDFTTTVNVVTQNIFYVTGKELIQPKNALLIGPCKVVEQEINNIKCKLFDIDNVQTNLNDETFGQIITDIFEYSSPSLVAYREGYRFIQYYKQIALPHSNNNSLLKHGGTYLITGGLNGIGLNLARHLAYKWNASLILVSRKNLPNKQEWKKLLVAPDTSKTLVKTLEILSDFDDYNIPYLVISADCSNLEDMKSVLQTTYQNFKQINGVIHAAGIAGGNLIQLTHPTKVANVFIPKIAGTLVLQDVLKNQQIDFFISCSSLSSIVGGVGQASYVSANAYLDSAMHQLKQRGINAISINWGTWSEIGMAVDQKNEHLKLIDGMYNDLNINHGISIEDGIIVFETILSNPMPQIIVSPSNLFALLANKKYPFN